MFSYDALVTSMSFDLFAVSSRRRCRLTWCCAWTSAVGRSCCARRRSCHCAPRSEVFRKLRKKKREKIIKEKQYNYVIEIRSLCNRHRNEFYLWLSENALEYEARGERGRRCFKDALFIFLIHRRCGMPRGRARAAPKRVRCPAGRWRHGVARWNYLELGLYEFYMLINVYI